MAYTDRLKEARKNKGLSQSELGKMLEIGSSTVSGYETGTRDPSMEMLQKIMLTLGVDANYLFQDEAASRNAISLAPDEKELLDGYHSLTDENKRLLLKTMHYLKDSEDMEAFINKVKERKS